MIDKLTINLLVDGQNLAASKEIATFEGTRRYIECAFNYISDDWKDCNKRAFFKNKTTGIEKAQTLGEDCKCFIPHEVLSDPGYIMISTEGQKNADNDTFIITTNTVGFYNNSTVHSGDETDPTPSEYMQVINAAEAAQKIAQSVRDDADSGKFNGKPGADGAPGADGKAATIAVGSVTTGEAGSAASVVNSGTASAAVLDFVIPQGAKGEQGEKGPQGEQGSQGEPGPQGEKGVSPTVSTEEIVGGTRVDITDVNGSHSFDVMNGINGAPSEFEVKNIADRVIDGQIKNGFEWDFDKVYLTMTFDDSNSDIDLLEDMAEEMGVPLCFATIPSKLGNTCTNGETVKVVLTRAVKKGGEVLSHYEKPLTSASTDEDYQKVYVETKKTLEENGFDVNGIITAGGADFQTQDFAKATKLARIYYQYADLTASNDKTNRQFYNSRKFTDNGLDDVKAYIDGVVANGSGWINLASHGTNNVNTSSVEVFREILEYAKDKGVEIVTWKYLFDNFGKVKNDCAVKSISVNGEKAEADESGNVNLEISSASENWRLICDETLTDEVQQVYKNKDMNGNSFNFKKLKIYVKSPVNTITAPITINIAGALRVSLDKAIATAVRYSLFTIECDDLACIIDGVMGFNDASYGMSSGYVKSINFGLTNISDFTVRCNNTQTKLLAGTQIKAWGC
uniref:Uncharacterized protein n=1 Tax=Siphoviridae sp. ctTIi48 TaxID=2827875 RepID=A0A8S5TLD3_9CAUD|nr:MAG TPA: hypothetical protein [Siphoviridae sp. ctTIi48]